MQQKTYAPVSIEEVKKLNKPSDDFLCSLKANTYNIQFLAFKIRDVDTKKVIFEIQRDQEEEQESTEQGAANEEDNIDLNDEFDDPEYRTVRYHFGPNFFQLQNIGTTLEFSVGNKPVKNLVMIERHYFKDHLIKSFEFKFPFCIPNTTNSWESIYELPQVAKDLQQQMIDNPWETKSDSFYFVDNQLIIHNKAEYNYEPVQEYDDDDEEEEGELDTDEGDISRQSQK